MPEDRFSARAANMIVSGTRPPAEIPVKWCASSKIFLYQGNKYYRSCWKLIIIFEPHGWKRTVLPYANSKVQAILRIRAVSPEPVLFVHLIGRPKENLIQRTRNVASIRGRTCPHWQINLMDCLKRLFPSTRFICILINFVIMTYGQLLSISSFTYIISPGPRWCQHCLLNRLVKPTSKL